MSGTMTELDVRRAKLRAAGWQPDQIDAQLAKIDADKARRAAESEAAFERDRVLREQTEARDRRRADALRAAVAGAVELLRADPVFAEAVEPRHIVPEWETRLLPHDTTRNYPRCLVVGGRAVRWCSAARGLVAELRVAARGGHQREVDWLLAVKHCVVPHWLGRAADKDGPLVGVLCRARVRADGFKIEDTAWRAAVNTESCLVAVGVVKHTGENPPPKIYSGYVERVDAVKIELPDVEAPPAPPPASRTRHFFKLRGVGEVEAGSVRFA